ncbi:hypothetical protein AVEN_107319-1 [Araneus ventricosus]|uniref:Uncharacterized protein n=1 Tax=Araneus ventricosus TaxID=182803 RepID=A0A4Y2JS58_ARAVE|nr:hypothetical protein AVEN_107319-1 [Araneus ventricosus]
MGDIGSPCLPPRSCPIRLSPFSFSPRQESIKIISLPCHFLLQKIPTGRHHEYVDEKPPDKQTGFRFPGGYNDGLGLPSAGDSRCLLRAMDGDGYYDSNLSTRAYCRLDAPGGFEPGRGDFDMNCHKKM